MSKKIVIGILIAVVSIIAVAADLSLSKPVEYTANEISIEDLPEEIREKAEEDVEDGGAYFYHAANDSEKSFVLLTFGNQLDLSMDVNIHPIEEGLYFSVSAVEENVGEQTVFKLYETDAPTISSDKNILENPRLVQGSVGINVGYLTKSGDGYYIEPLEDDKINDRVYSYAGDNEFSDGLYRFTYQLTVNGPEIISANAIDQYAKSGYVESVDADAGVVSAFLVGDESIKFSFFYNAADADMADVLESAVHYKSEATLNFTFHYDTNRKGLVLDAAKIANMPMGEIDNGATES